MINLKKVCPTLLIFVPSRFFRAMHELILGAKLVRLSFRPHVRMYVLQYESNLAECFLLPRELTEERFSCYVVFKVVLHVSCLETNI